MGKITINELHNSLFDYVQTVSDDRLETNNKTIVGAINELFSDKNNDIDIDNLMNEIANGKKLIADAIGEPLNAEDTFNEMSTDINSLLSTFKTNMMNNGITVKETDKFQELINKISALSSEIKIKTNVAIGQITAKYCDFNTKSTWTFNFDKPLGFTPDYMIIRIPTVTCTDSANIKDAIITDSNLFGKYTGYDGFRLYVSKYDENSFSIYSNGGGYIYAGPTFDSFHQVTDGVFDYIAIGVGEEDTTLSGGLDIISATKLPATGRENQICVITDNPDNKIVFVTNLNDIDHSTNNIYIYLGTSEANTYNTGKTYECDSGNFTFKLYIVKIYQNSKNLASYIYQNGTWVEYTYDYVYFIENGALTNPEIFGTIVNGNAMKETSTEVYICSPSDSGGYPYHIATTNRKIDFSLYNYIEVVGYHMSGSGSITMTCYDSTRNGHYGSYISSTHYAYSSDSFTTTSTVATYDISSWTSTGYLGFSYTTQSGNQYIYITDVRLR